MIRARVALDPEGRIRFFKAEGHAKAGDKGFDIVCAAFSVLARTAYRALEGLPGIEIEGSAPGPGTLSFAVRRDANSSERAAGIADFLVAGMTDLARDYSDAVDFVVEREPISKVGYF